jgi:predicted kinase
MYIMINGAFGVGKTTVARELRNLLPGSCIFDPEKIGVGMMYLPGYRASDFQHLRSWRKLALFGARLAGRLHNTVIIPMAFSEVQYLHEVKVGIASPTRPVLHFCLTAPLAVVESRLAARGEIKGEPAWEWVYRRAAECCVAHENAAFAVQLPTEHLQPRAVAEEVLAQVRAILR